MEIDICQTCNGAGVLKGNDCSAWVDVEQASPRMLIIEFEIVEDGPDTITCPFCMDGENYPEADSIE